MATYYKATAHDGVSFHNHDTTDRHLRRWKAGWAMKNPRPRIIRVVRDDRLAFDLSDVKEPERMRWSLSILGYRLAALAASAMVLGVTGAVVWAAVRMFRR